MSNAARWIGLLVFIGICFGVGALGAVATRPEIDTWYRSLNKPQWTPPGSIFGPVWTALYLLMGIAAWLVWQRGGVFPVKAAMILFAIQLLLNGAWSWIFFGMHRPDLAFFEILFLWMAIAATTVAFFRHSQLAAWLLIPYLGWVSFAAVLNFTIWRMNT